MSYTQREIGEALILHMQGGGEPLSDRERWLYRGLGLLTPETSGPAPAEIALEKEREASAARSAERAARAAERAAEAARERRETERAEAARLKALGDAISKTRRDIDLFVAGVRLGGKGR